VRTSLSQFRPLRRAILIGVRVRARTIYNFTMPTQFDLFVQVAGFIRALTNLHDNVVQNTQDWMTELQRTLDNSSREFAAAMAQFEKEQDEVSKVIALGGHGTSFHILAGPCGPSVAQCGRRRRDETMLSQTISIETIALCFPKWWTRDRGFPICRFGNPSLKRAVGIPARSRYVEYPRAASSCGRFICGHHGSASTRPKCQRLTSNDPIETAPANNPWTSLDTPLLVAPGLSR
jgi:hypothetical protein